MTVLDEQTAIEWEPGSPDGGPTDVPPADDRPRAIRRFGRRDALELGGAALAALCLALLVVGRFGPFDGVFGLLVIWYLGFVVIHLLVVREGHGNLAMRDRAATVLVTTAGVLTVLPLAFILTYVAIRGVNAALRWNFFSEDMSRTGASNPLSEGGILHSLVGTLAQVGLAMLMSVPLAMATAVYLNEVRGRFARPVRFFVNSLSGTPSIVAGLFIFSIFVIGRGFSGFAAALALSILMLPTVTRTAEEVLRLVPGGLREAALALGAPEWRVTMRVVLPTARSGIITAVILGVARVAGEAAPVLLTAFGGTHVNWNPFKGNQESLPLTVYSLVRQPSDNQQARAWGAGLVLMALILVLFALARYVASRRPGQKRRSLRLRRRRTAVSAEPASPTAPTEAIPAISTGGRP